MPIQLRHQTQQSVSPSALSHGVGLPVSDGGAGAASRALGQVAGAASQIGATLKAISSNFETLNPCWTVGVARASIAPHRVHQLVSFNEQHTVNMTNTTNSLRWTSGI